MKVHMYQGNEKMKKTCPKASKRLTTYRAANNSRRWIPSLPLSQELKGFLELYKSGWRSKLIMHSYPVIRVKLAIHSCNQTHTHTHTQRATCLLLSFWNETRSSLLALLEQSSLPNCPPRSAPLHTLSLEREREREKERVLLSQALVAFFIFYMF